jgi:glutamate-5-semialdehyde dehydrogenase
MNASEVVTKGAAAKEASHKLALASTSVKNNALERMAEALEKDSKAILEANTIDLEAGEKKGLSRTMLDRLALDGKSCALNPATQ